MYLSEVTFLLPSTCPPAPSATSPWRQAGTHAAVAGAASAHEERVLKDKSEIECYHWYSQLTAEGVTHSAKLMQDYG